MRCDVGIGFTYTNVGVWMDGRESYHVGSSCGMPDNGQYLGKRKGAHIVARGLAKSCPTGCGS